MASSSHPTEPHLLHAARSSLASCWLLVNIGHFSHFPGKKGRGFFKWIYITFIWTYVITKFPRNRHNQQGASPSEASNLNCLCNPSSPFSGLRGLEFLGLFLKWPPGRNRGRPGLWCMPAFPSLPSPTPNLSQELAGVGKTNETSGSFSSKSLLLSGTQFFHMWKRGRGGKTGSEENVNRNNFPVGKGFPISSHQVYPKPLLAGTMQTVLTNIPWPSPRLVFTDLPCCNITLYVRTEISELL